MDKRFLPINKREMAELGWDKPDFVYVTGDAYVDHPSFGTAIIGRILEAEGFSVVPLGYAVALPSGSVCREDYLEMLEEFLAEARKHTDADGTQKQSRIELEAHGVGNAPLVTAPVKLRRENTRCGYAPENAQIEDKNQLVGDRNARHRRRTDPPDHNVVQERNKVGNKVLNHNRQRYR